MTALEIISQVKDRTKHTSSPKVGNELKTAYRWAMRKVFNTENGPDLLVTLGEEHAIAARTRTYNLISNCTKPFLALKQLWLKLATDAVFTPMLTVDTNGAEFALLDAEASADTSVFATGHPVFYDVYDFGQIRIAPALPAGCTIRVDYYQFALDLGIESSGQDSSEGPEIQQILDAISDAILDKTTALVFRMLDDARELTYAMDAKENLTDAIWNLNRRVQAPTRTRPWKGRTRRLL